MPRGGAEREQEEKKALYTTGREEGSYINKERKGIHKLCCDNRQKCSMNPTV